MLHVGTQSDVERARRMARTVGLTQGLSSSEVDALILGVSELATNLVHHARAGQITIQPVEHESERGVEVVSQDEGPGIPDLEAAQREGYTTTGGFGSGFGVLKRQMDEFKIETGPTGTLVVVRKWHRAN